MRCAAGCPNEAEPGDEYCLECRAWLNIRTPLPSLEDTVP